MKRSIATVIVLALILALAIPAVAFADKGGTPNAKSQASPADKAKDKPAADAAGKTKGKSDQAKDKAAEKGKSDKAKPKDKAKDKAKAKDAAGDLEGSEDTSLTPETKRTGVENALTRLQSNLARMQAQVDAGNRKSLPPGLQRVIAKFMMWLGMTPDDGSEDPGDGSTEPTGTVEPTSTVEPTGTVEPTDTVAPVAP